MLRAEVVLRMTSRIQEEQEWLVVCEKQIQQLVMFESKNIVQIGEYAYGKEEVLGRGATGTVYKGLVRGTGQVIAVKVIRLSDILSKVKRHLLACEIDALTHISCEYVVHTHAILEDDEFYFIPMHYYPNGTLRAHIRRKKCLPPQQALPLFRKIVEGYQGIKQKGFLHRDLKTENILLSSQFDPIIIDFGYCERASTENKKLSYNVGSPGYMAPEAYLDNSYSQKSDIWALAVILHEMLTGSILYIHPSSVHHHFQTLKLMQHAEISQTLSHPFCRKLLLRMLAVDPSKRPTTEEVLVMLRQKPGLDQNMSVQLNRVPSVQSPNNSFHHFSEQENYSRSYRNLNMQQKQSKKTQPSFESNKKQGEVMNKGLLKLQKHLQYQPTLQHTQSMPNENTSLNHSLSPTLQNVNYCLSPKLVRHGTSNQYSFKKQKNQNNPETKNMFINKTLTPVANQRTKIITNEPFFRATETERLKMNSPNLLQKYKLVPQNNKFQSNIDKLKYFPSVQTIPLAQTQR